MKKHLFFCFLGLCAVAKSQSPLAAQKFGVFDFDLRGADHGEKVDSVINLGYDGLAMKLTAPSDLARWEAYKAARPNTKLMVGFLNAYIDNPDDIDSTHSTNVLQTLADEGAQFWCLFRRTENSDTSGLQALVDRVAARGAEFGLDANIYPHDGDSLFAIESVEEAMGFINQSSATNLKVSAHLCHEIRAGNGDRLEEVLRAAGDHLALVSINGADVAYVDDSSDWSATIQPLSDGDFDARLYVDALDRVGYLGPVILHTFGLASKPASHYQDSYNLWQNWVQNPRPTMAIYPARNNSMTLGFSGTLQVTTDLKNWMDIAPQPASPFSFSTTLSKQFYRAKD